MRDRSGLPEFTVHPIDRRRFLLLAGGLAAGAALAPQMAWAKRAARLGTGPTLLQPWSLPQDLPSNPLDTASTLIAAAVLAPSEWNSQPWRFEVGDNSVRLLADPARHLPRTDPDSRSLTIALGAALENLLVAARHYGLRPTASYFPRDGAGGVVAEVSWTSGEMRRDRALFEAIPRRRTNRRTYDGRGILPEQRALLTAQVPEALSLHWMDDRDAIRAVAALAHDAVRAQASDRRIAAEQYAWMRFGNDARKRGDGVPVDALELGAFTSWMAKRYFDPESWFWRFAPEHAAREARENLRSSGALALLCAQRRDPAQWLAGGQAFQRFALQAASLGLALQPMSAPIESPRYRSSLLRRFEALGEEPLVLLRLGHAKAPPPVPRRSVALVSTFRTS